MTDLEATMVPPPQAAADSHTEAQDGSAPAATMATDPPTQSPNFARSLLKIEVPVSVRLASKKQPIGQIVDLCPGSIIAFDKTCDEMLELCAGGYTIAVGEAVKVGDKFGLRISSMRLPDERFYNVARQDSQPDRSAAGAASSAPLPTAAQRT